MKERGEKTRKGQLKRWRRKREKFKKGKGRMRSLGWTSTCDLEEVGPHKTTLCGPPVYITRPYSVLTPAPSTPAPTAISLLLLNFTPYSTSSR